MTRALIGLLADRVAGRVFVPEDLQSVTSYGEECGEAELIAPIWDRIERLYRTGTQPGIQLCIRHRGKVVVERSIGHARGNRPGSFSADDAVPLLPDTPVNLFSAAKSVSAMVIHKLEELGALSIDDPVSAFVPGFERRGKGEITIRHVLSHRSGLPSLPAEAFDLGLLGDVEQVEAVVCEMEPQRPPGGPPAYSAVVGGFVLEAVARHASGRSMREVLATEIRDPLGVEWLDMGVEPEDAGSVAHNVETGLPLVFGLGSWMKGILGARWGHVLDMSNDTRFLSGVIPSGNVITTARDVAAFYQCLLNGGTLNGTRVFQEETVARALEDQGEGLPFDRKLLMPMRYSPGFILGSDTISFYGWNQPRIFGHLGLSNLYTWADPDRDLVVALLTTGKPMLGPHFFVVQGLLNSIHGAFSEPTPAPS